MVPCGKTSRAVVLPKSWIDYAEQKEGKPIKAIAMEIDGSLVLSPIFENSKDDVPQPPSTEHTNLANQPVKEVCSDV